MTQFWTILNRTTGEVLAPAFATEAYGVHPKDRGWPWDADAHRATRIDAAPDLSCQMWDGTAWVRDVDIARGRLWAAVKAKREAVQTGGCPTPSGRVQTDAESRLLILGAVTMAMQAASAGEPYSIVFTLADNSTVTLDAAQMTALGLAVGAWIAAAHARSVELRAAIDAAPDLVALDAIDIETGWPE